MQFQVGALPRPADLERQRERLMAEAPMDVSKAFFVQSSLEGEGEHKIIIRGKNQEYVFEVFGYVLRDEVVHAFVEDCFLIDHSDQVEALVS